MVTQVRPLPDRARALGDSLTQLAAMSSAHSSLSQLSRAAARGDAERSGWSIKISSDGKLLLFCYTRNMLWRNGLSLRTSAEMRCVAANPTDQNANAAGSALNVATERSQRVAIASDSDRPPLRSFRPEPGRWVQCNHP